LPQVKKSAEILNTGKFKELLICILNKIDAEPDIGETAFYKLLYFIEIMEADFKNP